MSKLKTAFKLIKENKRDFYIRLFENIHGTGVLNILGDKTFLKMMYRVYFGKRLDLDSPKTFNEKLQWLKLYNRRPEYITMVDKIAVKDYVAERIGPEYIIPTLGVWEYPEDIEWEMLPDQFVLKWNHDSGSIVICTDKTKFNREDAIKKLKNSANVNFFWHGREWPYKGVKPRLFAEKYISPGPNKKDLPDYKFMCFNGEVKCCFTCTNRFSEDGLKVTFYDNDWNIMPFERSHPREITPIQKPRCYNQMKEASEKLSQGLPFVRIDLYEIDGNPYFGEITFFPGNGIEKFNPIEWDEKLGAWIKLPKK